MNPQNSLPGPETAPAGPDPSGDGITPGRTREAASDRLVVVNMALPPVWRFADGHDEWCEGDYAPEVHMSQPCGCLYRIETGSYPDGQRAPE